MKVRLTLTPGEFYGWSMYPGYGGQPYLSPVEVLSIKQLGHRSYDLTFLNILYAAGLQSMTYRLRTLRRENTYIVAEQLDELSDSTTERVVILEPLTRAWGVRVFGRRGSMLFDSDGKPLRSEILGLRNGAY